MPLTIKLADFAVLDQNHFNVDRYKVASTQPVAVTMEGDLVHGEL